MPEHAAHARDRLRAVRRAAAERPRPARHQVQLRRGLPARAAVGAPPRQVRAERAAGGACATRIAPGSSSTAPRRGVPRAFTWRSRSPRSCASPAPSSRASRPRAATASPISAKPTGSSIGRRSTRPRRSSPHEDVRAYVEIVSEREGQATRAALTALAVSALLWLGWLSGLDASAPGAAVSLLLAGGAVVSGFAAVDRLPHHRRQDPAQPPAGVGPRGRVRAHGIRVARAWRSPTTVRWRSGCAAAILCSLATARLGWSAVRAAR